MKIDYEAPISAGSKLVGKAIGEVEKKFPIKIDHIHTGSLITGKRIEAKANKILRPGMTIKILNADRKDLIKFCKYYNLY